jgi:hypothetical protein
MVAPEGGEKTQNEIQGPLGPAESFQTQTFTSGSQRPRNPVRNSSGQIWHIKITPKLPGVVNPEQTADYLGGGVVVWTAPFLPFLPPLWPFFVFVVLFFVVVCWSCLPWVPSYPYSRRLLGHIPDPRR